MIDIRGLVGRVRFAWKITAAGEWENLRRLAHGIHFRDQVAFVLYLIGLHGLHQGNELRFEGVVNGRVLVDGTRVVDNVDMKRVGD